MGDGTADDIVRAALAELSMLVMQRTREQKPATAKTIDATTEKPSCKMHVDPDNGVE